MTCGSACLATQGAQSVCRATFLRQRSWVRRHRHKASRGDPAWEGLGYKLGEFRSHRASQARKGAYSRLGK